MGMTHDGGGVPRPKFFPAGLNVAVKPCDYCKSAAALLFCRVESAFMCIACDSKVHNAGDSLACLKHERVWMCEVCEQAPAVVTCKADAAALCVTCDHDIHSANPLASRHERVPVVPFYDTAESVVVKSTTAAATLLAPAAESDTSLFPGGIHDRKFDAHGGYIPDSWIPTSPIVTAKIPGDAPDMKAMALFFQDSDQFLDFDNYQISSQPYSDSVVPIQTTVKPPLPARFVHDHSPENRFENDFTRSNINSYNNNSSFTTPSLSHSVSSSSMDVGVVPDGSSLSEISYPFGRNIVGSTGDPTGNQGSQAVGMDREARVLRYKEKRKNRKFEKTIRYASRKAYAETRPRIKGRFAKRTDCESDIDRIFGAGAANFIADARFGIVPSF